MIKSNLWWTSFWIGKQNKGLTKISLWSFTYFWPGWYWPVNLEPMLTHPASFSLKKEHLALWDPHEHPFQQGDTMPANGYLVSALPSTPALLIYLLSLAKMPYKPNNSTFGSVQPASTYIAEFSVHPHSCWGEWTLSCISLYRTSTGFGELYPLFYCALRPVHMLQEKTKGLVQSLSAHGRHLKPSSREKKHVVHVTEGNP